MQITKGNQIVFRNINSGAPTTRTVNGLVNPVIHIGPGETQLWRLGNQSADIWYRLRLDGTRFHVIAEDGEPRRARVGRRGAARSRRGSVTTSSFRVTAGATIGCGR